MGYKIEKVGEENASKILLVPHSALGNRVWMCFWCYLLCRISISYPVPSELGRGSD